MPTRHLTEAQIQAVKIATILHLASLEIALPQFEASQIEELLRHPTKTMLVYLPANNRGLGGIFVDNIEPGYLLSLHNKGGQKLPGETIALMRAVNEAVAAVTFDSIDVCAGAAEAYAYLLKLEFAYRDVRPVELGYMTMYMFGAQNDENAPPNNSYREGRKLAWEAFQIIVSDASRTLNSALLADCFIALMAVVLQLQPPVGMTNEELVKTLLARLSTNGGAE
ncbi:MAG: hypothetical protein RI947_629 [Candidatus Parcubacteria bacterium]|jgi:hypothetical protein